MSASSKQSGVTIPQTSIIEREMLTVKWWPSSRMKVARFRFVTDDNVVVLDSLYVRQEPRSAQNESYYIRDATLDDIDDEILRWMKANGYQPAQEEVSGE